MQVIPNARLCKALLHRITDRAYHPGGLHGILSVPPNCGAPPNPAEKSRRKEPKRFGKADERSGHGKPGKPIRFPRSLYIYIETTRMLLAQAYILATQYFRYSNIQRSTTFNNLTSPEPSYILASKSFPEFSPNH